MKRIIIIGAGPAGLACGIWLRRLGHDPLIIEKGRVGGMLHSIHGRIPDYLGRMSQNGSELANHFIEHARELSLRIETGIEAIRIGQGELTVHRMNAQNLNASYPQMEENILEHEKSATDRNYDYIENLSFDACLLATGLRKKRLAIAGAENQQILYTSAGFNFSEKDVLIIGGGDGAFENAMKIPHTARRVLVAFRSKLRARPDFVREAQSKGVEFIKGCTPMRIEQGGHPDEKIKFIYEMNTAIMSLSVDCILVKIGFEPCSIQGPDCSQAGYVVVNQEMQTSMKGVWAAGDVISPEYPSISLATGQASVAAKSMERYLRNISV